MDLLLALMLLGTGEAENTGTILINAAGFESDDGQAVVALFTEEDWGIPPDPSQATYTYTSEISGLSADFQIPEVPSGRYAALAFHDVNRNGRFDAGSEMSGMMENAAIGSGRPQGPPSFEDISFLHQGTASSVRITVREMERPSGPPEGGAHQGGFGGGRPGGF